MIKQYDIKSLNVKICGICDTKTLEFLISNTVDFFGLIFYNKSPRYIDVDKAKEWIQKGAQPDDGRDVEGSLGRRRLAYAHPARRRHIGLGGKGSFQHLCAQGTGTCRRRNSEETVNG